MRNSLVGGGFKKLTVTFAAWTLLVIFAGATTRATDFSQSIAWVEHWIISGLTIAVTTTLFVVAWRYYRQQPLLINSTLIAVVLGTGQTVLSAIALINEHPLTTAINLLAAMLLSGIAIFLAVVVHAPGPQPKDSQPVFDNRFYFRALLLTGVGFLLLLVTGAFVTGTETGLACPDWPLCRGEIFPTNFNLSIAIILLHRFSVVIVGTLVAAVVLQTRRGYSQYPQLKRWSKIAGWLYLIQVGAGGLYALVDALQLIGFAHLMLTISFWASLIILITNSYLTLQLDAPSPAVDTVDSQRIPVRQKAKTFFKLTKPWILVLLLITTVTAMFIAAEGLPSISLILYTFLGGALSAGGASVLNSYIDSDIDGVMSRTSRRATVTGLATPKETLIFGLTLSALSFLIFALFVNMLSAILSTLGIFYYVFFYTLYLKRATIHNIIIGGAAGAIPPLVGWTAVTGSLDLGAFYLFAIIFFWTPPHTWALALLVKKDYAQARVPMLPVVVGEKETTYQILLYTILLVTLTLLPFTFNMLSLAYIVFALALGIPFIYLAWKLWRDFDKRVSKRLYKFSQAYLALLFLAMAIDRSLF